MRGGCDYSALAKVDAQLQELLNGRLDAIIDEKSSEAAAALLSTAGLAWSSKRRGQ